MILTITIIIGISISLSLTALAVEIHRAPELKEVGNQHDILENLQDRLQDRLQNKHQDIIERLLKLHLIEVAVQDDLQQLGEPIEAQAKKEAQDLLDKVHKELINVSFSSN